MNKKRTVLVLVLILLALGSGVGFVKVVLPAWRGPTSPLLIEQQKDPATAESGVQGHRDLRFRNQANKPLSVRLERTSCECAHIEACVIPDDWNELDSQKSVQHVQPSKLEWQKLERGGQPFLVPPGSHGMIRVAWKAFRVGDSLIEIDLRVNDGEKEIGQKLETPVNFVAPVFFCSENDPTATEIDVGRLKAGEERTAKFLCCSTTRDKFALIPAPASNDPCLVYGTPQPLTSEEIQALSRKSGNPQVRAAYRVKVTVQEQAGDHQLDIGPFHSRIDYKTDVYPDHQVTTYVNGTVVGEVGLADSDGKDHIDFGMIIPNDHKPVTFALESNDPTIQLSADEERTLPFFRIELLDGKEGMRTEKGKRWYVRVAFRPEDSFRGQFPDPNRPGYESADLCSIVFLISRAGQVGGRERRLLIPVRGSVRLY